MTTGTKKPKKMKPQRRWAAVSADGRIDTYGDGIRKQFAEAHVSFLNRSGHKLRIARVEIREVAK